MMKDDDVPPFSDLDFWEEEIFAQVGISLLITQQAEDAVAFTLKVVFRDGPLTFDDFTRKDKKTLGGLIAELRVRLEVDASFDALLSLFLEQRNLFVHSLRLQDWWDTRTEEGQRLIWNFLGAYFENAEQVLMAFTAYAFKLGNDIGMPETEEQRVLRANGFLGRIETEFYPRLDRALRRRPRVASAQPAPSAKTPRPNAPCSCGSTRKYKKCCGAKR